MMIPLVMYVLVSQRRIARDDCGHMHLASTASSRYPKAGGCPAVFEEISVFPALDGDELRAL
jgi:hypothetical protein